MVMSVLQAGVNHELRAVVAQRQQAKATMTQQVLPKYMEYLHRCAHYRNLVPAQREFARVLRIRRAVIHAKVVVHRELRVVVAQRQRSKATMQQHVLPEFMESLDFITFNRKQRAIKQEIIQVFVERERRAMIQAKAEHLQRLKVVVREYDQVLRRRWAMAHAKYVHSQKLFPVLREFLQVRYQRLVMNFQDKSAMIYYCNNAYWKVNNTLRGTVAYDDVDHIHKRIGELKKALYKRRPFVGTVYRGSNLPASVQASLKVGATYSDPAFLSTSRTKGKEFKRSYSFIIQSKTGVSVSSWAHYDEDEVLFQPDTVFQIVKMEQKQRRRRLITVVHMKELEKHAL
jgi:hypothetical protein